MQALLKILIKRIQVVGLLISVLVLNACSDGEKNSSLIFEELNESLERSNEIATILTNQALHGLEQNMREPPNAFKAEIWMPKAQLVHSKTTVLLGFIDIIIIEIKKVPQGKRDSVKVMISGLYKRLKDYRQEILNIDQQMTKQFEDKLPVFDEKFQDKYKDEKVFTKIVFDEKSSTKTDCYLRKFENDIRIAETHLIVYCKNQVPSGFCGITKDIPLTTVNSKHFKVGDELIINTGFGSFNYQYNKIIVNGEKVDFIDGISTYKMKVINAPGKYRIPVKIEYKMQDGKIEMFSDYVEYTVDK